METSEAEFENAVTIAIDWRDGEALSEAINKCASYCGKEVQSWEAFPERTFKFLIELFAQDCIVEFDGAYHLFLIFRHEWSRLSDLQRRKLMSLLNNACTKPMAAMTRFVICELLGEFYANAESLDLLKQFGMMQSEDSRLFVPHGLEHLIKESSDAGVRAEAADFLATLQKDRSEKVRLEAIDAAKAIGNPIRK
jgi:hypothetical protein